MYTDKYTPHPHAQRVSQRTTVMNALELGQVVSVSGPVPENQKGKIITLSLAPYN